MTKLEKENERAINSSLVGLDDVYLAFDDHVVFKALSVPIEVGESLVLVGPSGSGKSLFLKLLAGLVSPDRGRVLYKGKELSTLSATEKTEYFSQLGMLFQKNALFDSLSVWENLDFTLRKRRPDLSESEKKERIEHYLAQVGLDHVPHLFPSELSGGMQKRLGIARALVLQPRIVLYDDPTAGLDPITSRKIIQLILDLKEQLNATIVTVTHDMARAYQLAGHIMVCFQNEFILTGSETATRGFSNEKVQQFIHGRVQGPLGLL